MHKSALKNVLMFYAKYCKNDPLLESKSVLDVGSLDVQGFNMRPVFIDSRNRRGSCAQVKEYIGLDLSSGRNVDVVGSSHEMPFEDESFDIIISCSCFEHDDMFWVTFLEICRVLKEDGLIYIQAPSTGPYHGYPTDCWRFLKDSWSGLEKWANKNGHKISLVESYIDESDPLWNDNSATYRKSK